MAEKNKIFKELKCPDCGGNRITIIWDLKKTHCGGDKWCLDCGKIFDAKSREEIMCDNLEDKPRTFARGQNSLTDAQWRALKNQ